MKDRTLVLKDSLIAFDITCTYTLDYAQSIVAKTVCADTTSIRCATSVALASGSQDGISHNGPK